MSAMPTPAPVRVVSHPLVQHKLTFVSILRAGNGILDGTLSVEPGARVGHVGLYRDPRNAGARRVLLQDAAGHA